MLAFGALLSILIPWSLLETASTKMQRGEFTWVAVESGLLELRRDCSLVRHPRHVVYCAMEARADAVDRLSWPFVSILVPAYNEAETIQSARSLIALDYPHYEIVVIDDGSSDDL